MEIVQGYFQFQFARPIVDLAKARTYNNGYA